MTFIIADRVKESTTTTGVGTITLAGAATGFRAFSAVCANTDTIVYTISSSGGSEWECGLGTWATGGTLARTTVIASSNANAAVSFSAGTKDVYGDYLGEQLGTNNAKSNGCLTLQTGVPFPAADVNNATTVYWTPYQGGEVSLPTGGLWRTYRVPELSDAIGTVTSGGQYDYFMWDDAGTRKITKGPAWTVGGGDTVTRGTGAGSTEVEYLDGVRVNKYDISGGPLARNGKLVGGFKASSTTETITRFGGTVSQVGGKWFLWNEYNTRTVYLGQYDDTDSWTYGTNTIRQWNATAGNMVEYFTGRADTQVDARVYGINVTVGASQVATVGIGLDSTTTFIGLLQTGANTGVNALYSPISGAYFGRPGLGFHTIYPNERGGTGASIFLGDDSGSARTGLIVCVEI